MINVMSFQTVNTEKRKNSTDGINTDCSGSGQLNVELPMKMDRARPIQQLRWDNVNINLFLIRENQCHQCYQR